MNGIRQNATNKLVLAFGVVVICFSSAIAENIIKQEKMSFETCLKAIETSENKLSKLSVESEISEGLGQKRIALFKLADGTLKIVCDGEKSSITVSSHTN